MLKELADHLVAELDGLTLGSTLQVGFRAQDAPDACTALQARTGALADAYLRQHRQAPVQILTRGPGYHAAEAECKRIFEHLLSIVQLTLDGFHIYTASGIAPQYLGTDSKGRHEFSANVVLRLRED